MENRDTLCGRQAAGRGIGGDPVMKTKEGKRWIYTLLTLLVMAAIWLFSSADGTLSGSQSGMLARLLFWMEPDQASFLVRKTAHFTIYLILGFSMSGALKEWGIRHRWQVLLLTVLFCFLYACSDEWHQTFVAGRAGQFRDVCLDTAGSLTGSLLQLPVWQHHWRRKSGPACG